MYYNLFPFKSGHPRYKFIKSNCNLKPRPLSFTFQPFLWSKSHTLMWYRSPLKLTVLFLLFVTLLLHNLNDDDDDSGGGGAIKTYLHLLLSFRSILYDHWHATVFLSFLFFFIQLVYVVVSIPFHLARNVWLCLGALNLTSSKHTVLKSRATIFLLFCKHN